MAVELYIEDRQVDLIGRESISIDYAIFKADDITERKGVRSYSFNVPKTAINRAIFENPDNVTSISSIPYNKLNARLYVDGIDVGVKFCVIKSSGENYTLNLYGGNSVFFDLIRGSKLNEFNFCALNHTWDKATIIASRTNTSGYIYPIIDYHTDSPNTWIDNTTRTVQADNLYPALFYDDILERCINELGYDFVNDEPQPDLILAYSGHPFIRVSNGEYMEVKTETTSDQSAMWNIFHQMSFNYDIITQSCSYWVDGTTLEQTQFNFQDGVTISGRLYWILDNTTGSPVNCELWMGSDILGTPEFVQPITLATGINTLDYNFTLTNKTPDIYSLPIYFTIYDPADSAITVKSGTYIDITSVTVNSNDEVLFEPYGNINGYVTPTSIYGDITLAELIKAYCQMFGLIIVVDEFNKEVNFIKFDSILANNNIYDWSDKLDITETPVIEFGDDVYASVNEFVYILDDNEPKPTGTDGQILLDGDRNSEIRTIVELIYGATNAEIMLNNVQINKIGVLVNNSRQKQRAIRPLRLNLVDAADLDPVADLGYDDGSVTTISTGIPLTYFIDDEQSGNLGYGDNLLNTYYNALQGVIDKFKMVICQIRLNASDINQLDFTRPVYIKHFGAYFYISAIKGYTPTNNESTTVELVKLF